MAPTATRSQRDESIERGEEYDDFIQKVDVYHQQRGYAPVKAKALSIHTHHVN